jgi:pimeloyl-ACP methyl ester carboxylesterase
MPPPEQTWNGVALRSEFSDATAVPIHVLTAVTGSAEDAGTRVLAHSLTGHAHCWLPLVVRARAGRYVCPDFRGHGFSGWTRTGYWLRDYAEDLYRVCASLDTPTFDIVSPSAGGRVAVLAAARLGARVRRLVLLDSAPTFSAAAAEKVKATRAADVKRTSFREVDDVVQHWQAIHPDWASETIAVRAQFLYRRNWAGLLVLRNDPETEFYFGRAAVAEEPDVWAALERISAETFVVRAADSHLTDPDIAEKIVASLPNGSGVTVPGGHYLTYENPDRLAALVDDLLS